MDNVPNNKVGRPLKFKTSEALERAISEYFDGCEKSGKPLTMSGLAVGLGVNRQTLLNYSKDEEFFGTIKRAKALCERYAEEFLFSGKHVAGAIFNLKNNYSWKDKNEADVSITGKPFDLWELYDRVENEKKLEKSNETNFQ